jgi:hypothetical protein
MSNETSDHLQSLSDDVLLGRLSELLEEERRAEADVVALIAEVDARRLYAREAAPSMFVYCTGVLQLSEQEAYLRIAVARASRVHPGLLDRLRDGRLHLSGIARLAPHLTPENRETLLNRAEHRSRREIEELVAELDPKPDAPDLIRKLPTRAAARPVDALEIGPERGSLSLPPAAPSPAAASLAAASPAAQSPAAVGTRPGGVEGAPVLCPDRVGSPPIETAFGSGVCSASAAGVPAARQGSIQPLAPGRYRVQFTASTGLREKLDRLQALLRSSAPDVDLATVIEVAVDGALQRLEASKFGLTPHPRKKPDEADMTPRSRHVPAPVRRAVHERDRGQCTYVDARGRRCPARERLEFHHHGRPFGRGGDHSPANVRLACPIHNALFAELDYGKAVMERHRPSRARDPGQEAGRSARRPSPES